METQEKYDQAITEGLFRHLDKCLSDNTNSTHYIAWLLSTDHPSACLQLPNLYDDDMRWIYYPAKGQPMELTTSPEMFIADFTWISWMKAYLLDNRFSSTPTTTMKILYPYGRFKLINIGELVEHAKQQRQVLLAQLMIDRLQAALDFSITAQHIK